MQNLWLKYGRADEKPYSPRPMVHNAGLDVIQCQHSWSSLNLLHLAEPAAVFAWDISFQCETANKNRIAVGYPEFPESKVEGLNTMPWKSIIEHSQEIARFAEDVIPYLPEESEDALDGVESDEDGFWENIWA
ncbi:uncharacterized protein N7503_000331 [Penicillium pulvis]|uniref:uncharacterized protein n=1 Tax=Penicillium pulvis TaxID=1562058 RepID=UPI002547D069|nr:uncharacterized protein N7503_000331 [Penicillium pulvis]KAJ5813581.1 hypothetical protein N7503_000331 [Penicillium pulvis]